MFDEKKSKAFLRLKKICPDVTFEKNTIGKEVSCSGSCNHKGKVITFFSESIPEDFEVTLILATKVFENLDSYVRKAKDKICHVCLPLYLEDKDDDEPELNEEEYKNKLNLAGVSTFHENVVILDFCDRSTPYGHLLSATSLDKGKIFTDVEAVG